MADESAEKTQSQAADEAAQEAGGQEPKQDKTVPLSELVAARKRAQEAEKKLKAYEQAEEERKRGEMTELERLKADYDKVTAELTELKQTARKREALTKAISKIGDGWSVEHALEDLEELVNDLAYDEKTLDAKVTKLVEAAKRQKTPSSLPITGTPNRSGSPFEAPKPGTALSPAEIAQLAAMDPEGFAKWQAESRAQQRARIVGAR